MRQSYNDFGPLMQGRNYPDNYGLGQQFANDFGRANDEHAKRLRQEQKDRLKARRVQSRLRGYRPSRCT